MPNAESVRLEALRRSWQRDREVSRRRLRARWIVWACCRYGLPLLLVLGTAVAAWIWALPYLSQKAAQHAPSVRSEAVPAAARADAGASAEPGAPEPPSAPLLKIDNALQIKEP